MHRQAPSGYRNAQVQREVAFWHEELSEFLLPYDDVQSAADPDAAAGQRGASPAPQRERVRYKAVDSLFANNRALAATGTGASLGFKDIDPSFIELVNTQVSRDPLVLEMDESKRGYLHPLPGSDAAFAPPRSRSVSRASGIVTPRKMSACAFRGKFTTDRPKPSRI